MDPKPEAITPRDCAAKVRELTAEAQRRAAESRRCFRNTVDAYAGRYNLAWWPEHPEREPVCSEGLFFYRPGELLVSTDALAEVRCVLTGLGVTSCVPESAERAPVTRILVATAQPVPLLVRQLRRLGLGPRLVTLNHVWWPSTQAAPTFTIEGAPWLSGGADSVPQVASGQPDLIANRGSGVAVAVFDSALLTGWATAHTWMNRVSPFDASRDVDAPDGPGGALDIYDSHGVAVAGVLAARAGQATIRLRDVLDELGDVDEWKLIEAVRQTLLDNRMSAAPADRIRIVNLSLGGTTMDNQPPLGLAGLLGEFPEIVFVAAAGNNGLLSVPPVWPAAFPGVIGVGALDTTGQPALFSNDYPSADVWAPGQTVLTAFGSGPLAYPAGQVQQGFQGVARWSGTSFAAPYVSGLLCEFFQSGAAGPVTGATGAVPSMTTRALGWLITEVDTGSVADQIRISGGVRGQFA